jgi:hypothetical protein
VCSTFNHTTISLNKVLFHQIIACTVITWSGFILLIGSLSIGGNKYRKVEIINGEVQKACDNVCTHE